MPFMMAPVIPARASELMTADWGAATGNCERGQSTRLP